MQKRRPQAGLLCSFEFVLRLTSNQCGRPPPPPLLPDDLAPLDDELAELEEADAPDDHPVAEPDPPRELPEPLPPELYVARSETTARDTFGGATVGRGGAALRALGTAELCASRPAALSETAGTCSVEFPERLCSGAFFVFACASVFTLSAFTNRRSARSYTIVELPFPAEALTPEAPLLAAIVRTTCEGATTSAS